MQGGCLISGTRKKNGPEFVAKYEQIDMDDSENGGKDGDFVCQAVDIGGGGLNYCPFGGIRLSVNGILCDIDSALDRTSKDEFKNENSSWAIIMGVYFNLARRGQI